MIIYRVENDIGEGPYQCLPWYIVDQLCDPIRHPEPTAQNEPWCNDYDRIPELRATHIFGFKNMESLEKWFGEHWHTLDNYNLQINTYLVDPSAILFGASGQVSFERDKSTAL